MKTELREINKRYGKIHALSDLSLELEAGCIHALLGINGAGKTTLLRVLAGIAAPESGAVLFDGVSFGRNYLAQRQRLQFLPDFPAWLGEETILRNLSLILKLYDRHKPEAEKRVATLLDEFDLLGTAGAPAALVSRGQSYKAALVALIAVDPDLWLLDEPLASGMDPRGLNAWRRHAREAADRGRTVVYSTQILELAATHSDNVIVLNHGRLCAKGSMEKLRQTHGLNNDPGNALGELFDKLSDPAAQPKEGQ